MGDTVKNAKCLACDEKYKNCQCTGGPNTGEPECTCYEAHPGHEMGCPMYRWK